MAWIKIDHVTPDKPEVALIAARLKIDPDAVVGKLLRLWIWADQNSLDGNAVSVTDSFLDRITHRKGFAAAMRAAGWLDGKNGGVILPNFERHNGQTAKGRATTNRRVAKHRGGNANVTQAPLQKPLPDKEIDKEDSNDKSLLSGERGDRDIPTIVSIYPKRERQAEAIEALAGHVRKGADLDSVISGTRAIAAIIARLPGGHLNAYVPSAAVFFRNRRWEDDPHTWLRNAGKHTNGAPQQALDLGGRKAAREIHV